MQWSIQIDYKFHFQLHIYRPDTAPYLEKLEQERLAKERGEDPRDNRSFLAKYVSHFFSAFFNGVFFLFFCVLIFIAQISIMGWPGQNSADAGAGNNAISSF